MFGVLFVRKIAQQNKEQMITKNTVKVVDATNDKRSLTLSNSDHTVVFTLTDSDNSSRVIRVSSADELLKLSDYLWKTANIQLEQPTSSRPFHPSKMGICIFDHQGNRLKELFDTKSLGLPEDLGGYTYQSLTETFGYQHAVYALFIYDGSIGRESIISTIQACVKLQREFVVTGNYFYAKPLTLKEVAIEANLDITTVSRCARRGRVYGPNKVFTLDNHESTLDDPSLFDESVERFGEPVSRLEVLQRIKDMIDHEDKRCPLGDDAICQALKDQHFNIERRTVAKYRGDILGFDSSSHRREK